MSRKGRVFSEKHKRKLSKVKLGHKHSEETKRKISESLRDRPSPMLGRKHSPETIEKMRESHKGRRHDAWNFAEDIIYGYVQEKKTPQSLCKQYNCALSTIVNILKANKTKMRTRKEAQQMRRERGK